MNKTFIHNFCLCLRYIWQIHRRFYVRNVVGLALIVLFIFLLSLLPNIANSSSNFSMIPLWLFTISNMLVPLWAMLIVCCTFHPLHTRANRADFLILPVGNAPKFWAMIAMSGVSVILMTVITEIVVFMVFLMVGKSDDFVALRTSFDDMIFSFSRLYVFNPYNIGLVLFPSIALWINSVFYRHNIVCTSVVLIVILTVMVSFGDSIFGVALLDTHSFFIANVILWLVSLALAVCCWRRAYVNFCHSQIVDRHNH